MIALEAPTTDTLTLPDVWDEALLQLELRVARRADKLLGGRASDPERDRLLWFEAERIVFGEVPVTNMITAEAVAAA